LKIACSLLLLLALAACSSTPAPDDNLMPPPADRQSQLTALFDRFSGEDSVGRKAATEAARLEARERRYFTSLWGTRSSDPAAGWRLGDALAEARIFDEAFEWYQRAFLVIPSRDSRRSYLRYEMARCCLALGKPQDAINLLANRIDPAPLPEELRAKYDALLDAAAKASR
jgi:tetratricopeptide (TPR) repeat protein